MNTIKNKLHIKEFLSTVKYRDFVNLCDYVYKNYFNDLQEDTEVLIDKLITFMEWSFKSNKTFDISETTPAEASYAEQYDKASGIFKPIIDNLIQQDVEERDFYVNIWNTFSNSVLFASDEDRIGALIFLLSYDKVPYFKMDKPLEVKEDEFDDLFEKLDMSIQKCIYVFNRGYEFRTEVASQLLRLIENESDEKRKVVLLTCILHYLEWTTEKNCRSGKEEESEEQK